MTKKEIIRSAFRDSVFKRANYRCEVCKLKSTDLDAHHITDRNLMPNGGYCKENGIALCPECHIKAEYFHCNMEVPTGYMPEDLYKLIKSSYDIALEASKKLKI